MSTVEKPTECAACGKPLGERRYGKYRDFCSPECLRLGRLVCKCGCGRQLDQRTGKGTRKDFYEERCTRRYRYVGIETHSTYWEERYRTTCKCGCGRSITQPKQGGKQFYDNRCGYLYHSTLRRGLDLTQKWGTFAPETRKMLLEVEDQISLGAAMRLETAINREYALRGNTNPRAMQRNYITCTCKACGNPFRRTANSQSNRDYCDQSTCRAERRQLRHTTWEEVDEIRRLYAAGVSSRAIAEKFGCEKSTILRIANHVSHPPECDPRVKGHKQSFQNAKLNWEQVHEIRTLYVTGRYTIKELGDKFSVHYATIGNIIRNMSWNPDDDPRKEQVIKPQRIPFRQTLRRQAKLTWGQVDEIRSLYKPGLTKLSALAENYGVTATNISDIVRYRTWKPEHDPRTKTGEE